MAESVLRRLSVHVSSPVAHLVVIMAIVYIMSWVSYSAIEVPAKRWYSLRTLSHFREAFRMGKRAGRCREQ